MSETVEKTLVVKTMKRLIDEITLDISDESCRPLGPLHKELVICPDGIDAVIGGVAPGNDGVNQLWYTKIHPSSQGRYCYYERGGNLFAAGFRKKILINW